MSNLGTSKANQVGLSASPYPLQKLSKIIAKRCTKYYFGTGTKKLVCVHGTGCKHHNAESKRVRTDCGSYGYAISRQTSACTLIPINVHHKSVALCQNWVMDCGKPWVITTFVDSNYLTNLEISSMNKLRTGRVLAIKILPDSNLLMS